MNFNHLKREIDTIIHQNLGKFDIVFDECDEQAYRIEYVVDELFDDDKEGSIEIVYSIEEREIFICDVVHIEFSTLCAINDSLQEMIENMKTKEK